MRDLISRWCSKPSERRCAQERMNYLSWFCRNTASVSNRKGQEGPFRMRGVPSRPSRASAPGGCMMRPSLTTAARDGRTIVRKNGSAGDQFLRRVVTTGLRDRGRKTARSSEAAPPPAKQIAHGETPCVAPGAHHCRACPKRSARAPRGTARNCRRQIRLRRWPAKCFGRIG